MALNLSALNLNALDAYVIQGKPHKTRFRCKECGACVAGYNSVRDRWSVWGAQLERQEKSISQNGSGSGSGGSEEGEGEGEGKEFVPSGMRKEVWEVVKPTAHIFYGTRMVDVRDGLGKWEGYEGISERILE